MLENTIIASVMPAQVQALCVFMCVFVHVCVCVCVQKTHNHKLRKVHGRKREERGWQSIPNGENTEMMCAELHRKANSVMTADTKSTLRAWYIS